MKPKELERYRRLLEGLISGLGREDVAVGEISESDGKLLFALLKRSHTYRAEIPLAALADSKQVRAAVNAVLFKLHKAIEQENAEAGPKVA